MNLPVYITHADCLRHEMGAGHPECPERVAIINDRLLMLGLLDGLDSREAPLVTDEQLMRVHSPAHLATITAASPARGHAVLDADTCMNPFSLEAARRAAGAAVLATDLVASGAAPTAFCNVRPPGHHATRDTAMGFCLFNNVAVGMAHALEQHGIERVALIDFDVHHGNGSEAMFAGDPRVLMCGTFQRALYPYSGDPPLADNMVNVPLAPYSSGDALRAAVEQHWMPALDAFRPQMLFISAGFDAHRDDELAMLGWVESDYTWVTERLVEVAARHCQGRIVSCLEGGYALDALARSVAAHVKVLAGMSA
ncbi:histone deacetylase family protein [soil metagenome]